MDNHTYEHDLKDFSFTFVELPKFTKTIDQLRTIEDKWYYFLKHANESNEISEVLSKHPEIKEAYDVLDRYHWTEGELQYYDKLNMNAADLHGTIEASKKEGKEEVKVEIAKTMLKKNFSIDEILEITGLSIREIENLKS